MPWFKVDDRLPDHTKTRRAGTAAIGLWALAGAWSAGNLTDGFVPKVIAKRWDPSLRMAKKLVESGMWFTDESDGEPGYRFHDWHDHQPSRDDVLARRRAAADRVARHRAKRETQNADVSNDESNAASNALHDAYVTPPPTRPDPTRPEDKEHAAAAPTPSDAALFPVAVEREPKRAVAKTKSKEPAKPEPVEQRVTAAAYERTGKAFRFVAVRAITKWAIHDRGADPGAVEAALVGVHELGKPITRQTVAQWLDGHIGPNRRPGPSKQDAKVAEWADTGRRVREQLAAARGATTTTAHHLGELEA